MHVRVAMTFGVVVGFICSATTAIASIADVIAAMAATAIAATEPILIESRCADASLTPFY